MFYYMSYDIVFYSNYYITASYVIYYNSRSA